MAPLQVLLVANYTPDAQQSMQRFAAALEAGLRAAGYAVTTIRPRQVLGGAIAHGGAAKWLGYVDKFVLFPWALRAAVRRLRRAGAPFVVHVCDHSNAIYTRYLRDVPHLVTCNDMLAVRSARGEVEGVPTRWSGRLLQRFILAGLNRARQLACISDATRRDVLRLTSRPPDDVHRVYMGLSWPYAPVSSAEADARPASLEPPGGVDRLRGRSFILHVGGNQWYKNRPGVLTIYAALKRRLGSAAPALVMAGSAFTAAMRDIVTAHALDADVVELVDVPNELLAVLYSRAALLLYPSRAEGFGWPVLEAMACGCPVVASNRAPLTEVGGDAAVYVDPDDVDACAQTVARVLGEPAAERQDRRARGFVQQRRFSTEAMIRSYRDLYARSTGAAFADDRTTVPCASRS